MLVISYYEQPNYKDILSETEYTGLFCIFDVTQDRVFSDSANILR